MLNLSETRFRQLNRTRCRIDMQSIVRNALSFALTKERYFFFCFYAFLRAFVVVVVVILSFIRNPINIRFSSDVFSLIVRCEWMYTFVYIYMEMGKWSESCHISYWFGAFEEVWNFIEGDMGYVGASYPNRNPLKAVTLP